MSLIDAMKLGGMVVFGAGMIVVAARLLMWALDFDFFSFKKEDEIE
jgi:hypothetical protein